MIKASLTEILSSVPLGPLRYFDQIDSTNAEALRWARDGAPNLSLVVADEQTAGRGRMGRHWFTPRGSALAFSLVMRPEALSYASAPPARLTALGAQSVCTVLRARYRVQAQIKWPNDVLVEGRKLAGVLVEADWLEERLQAAVIGIGINVAWDSVPPAEAVLFPATCVEAVLGMPVDRWDLLCSVLVHLLDWLPRLETPEFLNLWESRLAYLGEWVQIVREGTPVLDGQLLGLAEDGSLRLGLPSGEEILVQAGDLHLRVAEPGQDR
jgi:BirA family biotin operon repressor/biotin-[acetyl-CoA-carboxylase] ligase